MRFWKENGFHFCEPDCADEWLQLIEQVAFDYDGCKTAESLKSLVDEIVEMAQKARVCLRENKVMGDGVFSGVTDKDGKRIFEGDKVSGLFYFGREVIGVCAFRDGSFGLRWTRDGTEEFTPFTSMCNVELRVISEGQDGNGTL